MKKEIKISPLRMQDMLKWATANKMIENVKLEFGEDGVIQRQTDAADVIGVFAKYSKKYFTKYNNIGTIVLEVPSFLGIFDKFFKKDADISVIVNDDSITFRGSEEEITRKLLEEDIQMIYSVDKKLKITEYGIVPENTEEPDKIVIIDASNLKSIPESENLVFDFNKKNVSVSIYDELGSMKKKMELVVNKGDAEGQVVISGRIFKKIVSTLRGPIILGLSSDKPLIMTTRVPKTDEYIVTYMIAPKIETEEEGEEYTEEEGEDYEGDEE